MNKRAEYVLAMQQPSTAPYMGGLGLNPFNRSIPWKQRGRERDRTREKRPTPTPYTLIYIRRTRRFNDNSVTVTRFVGIETVHGPRGWLQMHKIWTNGKKVGSLVSVAAKTYHSIQLIYLIFLGGSHKLYGLSGTCTAQPHSLTYVHRTKQPRCQCHPFCTDPIYIVRMIHPWM